MWLQNVYVCLTTFLGWFCCNIVWIADKRREQGAEGREQGKEPEKMRVVGLKPTEKKDVLRFWRS